MASKSPDNKKLGLRAGGIIFIALGVVWLDSDYGVAFLAVGISLLMASYLTRKSH